MSNRQDYIAEVKKLVPGDNLPCGEPEIILAIEMAMKVHSRHRPHEIVDDIDGNGGFDYALANLDEWSEGFSTVKEVEYPVDDTDETPDILQEEEYSIYKKPSGTFLRFLDDTPDTDEDIRITYTAMHTCTDEACTVVDFDEKAVQALAAGLFCETLATAFASDQDSTIGADSVNEHSKAARYQTRARVLKRFYYDHVGIKEGEAPAASVTMDWDKAPSWQSDRITHGRRYR